MGGCRPCSTGEKHKHVYYSHSHKVEKPQSKLDFNIQRIKKEGSDISEHINVLNFRVSLLGGVEG